MTEKGIMKTNYMSNMQFWNYMETFAIGMS